MKSKRKRMSVEFAPDFWVQKKERVLTPEDEQQIQSIKQRLILINQEIASVDSEIRNKRTDADLYRQEAKMGPAVNRRLQQGIANEKDEYADALEKRLLSLQEQRAAQHVAIEVLRQYGVQ